ncbi:hypothetical protein V2W45_1472529 [Cenococcum geophilum]
MIVNPLLAVVNPLNKAKLVPRQSPSSDQIQILDLSTSGNGYLQGTVSAIMPPDCTVITFGFDTFQAYSDHSKNCQIHLSLKYPGELWYSVLNMTYHGYARLGVGVTGSFYSAYFFSQAAENTYQSTIPGPELRLHGTATVWFPCGTTGILGINNRMALTANCTTAAGELP